MITLKKGQSIDLASELNMGLSHINPILNLQGQLFS